MNNLIADVLPQTEMELKRLRAEVVKLVDEAQAKNDKEGEAAAIELRNRIDDALDDAAFDAARTLARELSILKSQIDSRSKSVNSWPLSMGGSSSEISENTAAARPTEVNRDLQFLHPLVREKCIGVLRECQEAGLPFKIFEAWRSPARQNYLYQKGRTTSGRVVTYARAWQSYHQYGLAADFVGFVNGAWTWELPNQMWTKLHRIGESRGLERLGFETPHLQLAGIKIGGLMEGNWPGGGDGSWQTNLSRSIAAWHGDPPAPPLLAQTEDRPALISQNDNWAKLPSPGSSDWHLKFDGQEWRFDTQGVYLRGSAQIPLRSPGAPTTCQAILELYAEPIQEFSLKFQIPPELIVMTIAAETATARGSRFTGPATFRWEPHVKVSDVTPSTFGDYSAGPMQTLATTARAVIAREKLPYDPFKTAPYYADEPRPAPAVNPLYDGRLNIELGCAEIKTRLGQTGYDPILVAAAYNAGGLYRSELNSWHLRSANDHLDRAARWYGDACFVLSSLRSSA